MSLIENTSKCDYVEVVRYRESKSFLIIIVILSFFTWHILKDIDILATITIIALTAFSSAYVMFASITYKIQAGSLCISTFPWPQKKVHICLRDVLTYSFEPNLNQRMLPLTWKLK